MRDLRVARAPVTPDDLIALETDVLAGFVLARAAAGLADSTIASDVMNLEQVRAWLGRPFFRNIARGPWGTAYTRDPRHGRRLGVARLEGTERRRTRGSLQSPEATTQ